ncbi:MAG: HDOD domain-containing protein [Candidatus Sedimenticola sp. (ex Thyasira tokunagai)]
MSVDQLKLERLVDKMPTFPQSVHRVIQICSDINFSTKELISVIEHDPIITLKTLKLVNSAYFGLSKKITSIKHAVVYIGANTIKNVAMAITTMGILPKEEHSGINRNGFLLHCLNTATLAKLIAKGRRVPESELTDYFIAGLLHDIGVILAAQLVKDQYKEVTNLVSAEGIPLHLAERQILGFDHAEMSAILVEKWKFPENLINCIRNHHSLHEMEDPPLLERVIFVANQVAKSLDDDEHRLSVIEPVPEYIQQWLGMSLEEVPESISDLPTELEKAEAFLTL